MVSVDDLIISLRIDESSNLGKLQKQLEGLVGPKGEKAVGIGLDADTKRDLKIIKDRIVKFTPSVLMDQNLKEAALNLASDLKKDTGLRDVLLQRYGINILKYETFLEELFNIALGISELNSDQQKGFIAEMDHFRKIAVMDKGERKTFITKLSKMMLEKGFHKTVVNALREAGVKMLSKPAVYELTKGSIGKKFDETIERFEGVEGFEDLVKIFTENTDTLSATSEAYKLQTGKTLDLTQLTQKQIYDNVKLHMIIAAQAKTALTKSNWMLEVFYKSAKELFTKTAFAVPGPAQLDAIIHKISSKTLEGLGIEHVVGDKIDDSMTSILTEFKTVAGKAEIDYEDTKRVVKQGYNTLMFVVDEVTNEAVNRIKELKAKEEYKDKKIGLYKLNPRAVEKLLGIASKLDDLEEKATKSLAEDEKRDEKDEEEKSAEQIELENMRALMEDLDELGGEQVGGLPVHIPEGAMTDKLDDLLDKLDDIDATTKDTNKEVKEEDLNKPNVEEDPTGDNE